MDKKYFLRDQELHSVDDDFFRHQDIADNITRILETNKPPYNIAVIGKWGLGKSSLINLVTNKLEEKQDYTIVHINAWKYEKEVLGKVFLRQVLQKMDENYFAETHQEKQKHLLENIINKHISRETRSIFKQIIDFGKKYWQLIFAYGGLTFGIYAFYKVVALWLKNGLSIRGIEFLAQAFTGYCRNIAVLLFAPILLTITAEVVNSIKEHAFEKVELSFPEISVEDYEIELQRKIKNTINGQEDFKIVIVLEDLDRLSFPKMVEALDAIKMFINFPNCIFVVPFDDSIIKAAISNERTKKLNESGVVIASELLLDKLFQYKVYLAPLLNYDIRKYAIDLCTANLKDFLGKYCDEQIFVKVVRTIVIHREVQTPRQVKKLVNIFVTNMMLAKEREDAHRVEPGFASSEQGICMIAKLSVLQADFNEFYDLLFLVPNAMEIVLEAQRDNAKIEEMPEELKQYFRIDDESKEFGKEFIPLLNFLNMTSKHKVNNLLSYLYVAMDDISILTGSVKQQEFIRAATSNNMFEVKRMLGETPELVEAAKLYLSQEVEIEDVKSLVKCLVQDMEFWSLSEKQLVSSAIAERAEEIATSWNEEDDETIDYHELIKLYSVCDNPSEYAKILIRCLNMFNEITTSEKLRAFVENMELLHENEIEALDKFIKRILEEDIISLQDFMQIRNGNSLFNNIWMQTYYSYLINKMKLHNDYSSLAMEELEFAFGYMKEKEGMEYCLNALKNLFNQSEMTNVFYELLKNREFKKEDQELLNDLVYEQISNRDGNEVSINKLLKILPYDVEKGKESVYNDYFINQIESNDFGKIIKHFAKRNDIKMIDKCVTEIIRWMSQSIDDKKVNCFKDIISILTEQRRRELFEKIKNQATLTPSRTYEYIDEIVVIYAEEAWDEIHGWIGGLLSSVKSLSATDNYISFVEKCYSKLRNKLSENEMEEFVKELNIKYKQNRCVESCHKALCNCSPYISDEMFSNDIEPTLYDSLKSDNCYVIFKAYKHHLGVFTRENEKDNNLLEVCFEVIEKTQYYEEAIYIINNQFDYIEQLPRFVDDMIQNSQINRDENYKMVARFLEKMELEKITKTVLEILKRQNGIVLNRILDKCDLELRKNISTCICNDKNSLTEESILNYLVYIVNQNHYGLNESISDLICNAVNNSEKECENEKIVEILESMKLDQFNKQRKKYITPIVNLLLKTTSTELKKRILNVCKKIRITQEVTKQTPANLSGELKKILENCKQE